MHLSLLVPFLFWISGCCTAEDSITGPEEVRGREQGSLTVQCRYTSQWKDYIKYWCRGDYWKSCKILVETDKPKWLLKENRVSISDNQRDFIFTVTMKDLKMSDADIYWCGITRVGYDPMFKVKVDIDPATQAPITVSTTTTITSTTTIFTVTTAVTTAVKETNMFSTLTSHYSDNRHGSDDDGSGDELLDLSVLLPVISAALLLLLLVVSLFAWRMVKRQKKAAGPPSEQAQSLEDDLCYANLSLQPPRISPGSSWKKGSSMSSSGKDHQEEVEYVTMAPFPREEISYAALSLASLGQEPTYSNTGCLVTHVPSTRPEGETTEYSSIRRPLPTAMP